MTDPKRIHDALEQIAGEAVPENTDLWGQIRAKAALQQHTQPVRVRTARPAFRPNMPGLRLAGAALALLLCVGIGYGMVRSLLNPGMPPVIALLTTPFYTSSPSPAADPSALAQAVQATVTAFQPEDTATQAALVPQSTPTQALPVIQQTEPAETAATPVTPTDPPAQPTPAVERTPTEETDPAGPPVITGMGVMNLGSQTHNGITVTLDWANVDESHLFFQYTVRGLPEEEGLDLRGAVRVTSVTSDGSTGGVLADLTGTEAVDQTITSVDGALIIRETRDVQHTARPGRTVDFQIDITAGGVTLPRTVTGPDGSTTAVEGVALPLAGVFEFDVAVPFHPALRLEPGQSTEVNGVRMELNWMRVSHYAAELGVCFNVPAPGNWQLDSATTLQFGEAAAVPLAQQGIDLSQPNADPTATPLRRCLHASFHTLYDGAPAVAIFTIPSLATPVDFVNNFEEASRLLAAQGIKIEKAAVASGFEIRIIQKPETMSDEEANRLLFEAAQQVETGPWVFSIPVPGR